MMHGRGKSDLVIVAVKPTNKAERSAAEPAERRAGTKGNVDQTARTGHSAGHACHLTWNAYGKAARLACQNPRWEPCAGKLHARICAGGAQQWASLPRPAPEQASLLCSIDARDLLRQRGRANPTFYRATCPSFGKASPARASAARARRESSFICRTRASTLSSLSSGLIQSMKATSMTSP
jgi:hypothetical protein